MEKNIKIKINNKEKGEEKEEKKGWKSVAVERKDNHGQWYLLDHIKCVGIALQAL